MATSIKIDIKQASVWRRDKNGDRATRIAHITGLDPLLTPDQILKAALDDPIMPQYGDAHPQDADITVQSITVRALGGGIFQANIDYFTDPGSVTGSANASASVSAATTLEEVGTDAAGNALATSYTVTNSSFSWTLMQPRWTAEVERPRITYRFEYTSATFPKTEIDTYLGKVNSLAWNGYSARKILCIGIDVDQVGTEYRVRFMFALNENTWDFVGVAPDAPGNIASSGDGSFNTVTGTKTFQVYSSVDFTPLGFVL